MNDKVCSSAERAMNLFKELQLLARSGCILRRNRNGFLRRR